MNRFNKRNVFERGMEVLAWLQAYAPDIPEDRQTTMRAEFSKMRNILKLASDYVGTEDAKRYLVFCEEELGKAETDYDARLREQAVKHMDGARWWFQEAQKDKKSKPTFVVGPDGQAEKLTGSYGDTPLIS